MSRSSVRRTVALAGAALAASACVAPFPGSAPSITWVDSPAPAAFELAEAGEVTSRYELAEVTEPSWVSCGPSATGPFAAACESYYQGTGFVVRVPDACQSAVRGADAAAVPKLRLEVDGVAAEIDPFPWVGTPLGTTAVRSGIYVTVSGPGTLTSGFESRYADGTLFSGARVTETPRAPERDRYDVRLACADAPGAEPGTWSVTTYTASFTRP